MSTHDARPQGCRRLDNCPFSTHTPTPKLSPHRSVPTEQLLPALVRSLGGPNAGMPRLQAASAGALLTFCNPARMRAEWLYVAAPSGIGADGKAIGAALLEALCELVRSSPSIVVKEEALTAVGCVAQASHTTLLLF